MANRIVLNTPKYKGEYDFDIEEHPLTALEWRWVKKISGYLPLTLAEGLQGADPDLFVAFAVVALHRAGQIQKQDALQVADVLADSPFDGAAITFIGEEADADVPPPEPATTPETGSTGGSSNGTSDIRQVPTRTPIGARD